MGLLSLIREHGDAIEADLAFRGFDLLDMWRGTLSPRKVDVLIRGLPADSATRMSINGEPLWGRTDYILADLIDATNGHAWLTANSGVELHRQSKFPESYPRPSAVEKKTITADDLMRFRARTRRE